jgi:hypothetical protein
MNRDIRFHGTIDKKMRIACNFGSVQATNPSELKIQVERRSGGRYREAGIHQAD